MSPKLELPLAFAPAEYAQRQERARQEIKHRNLQALLVFSQHSQYYLYGYQVIHAAILFQLIILPAEGKPIAIVRSLDEPILRCASYDGEIIVWGLANDDPIELVIAALKKAGLLKNGRLGIETRHHALGINYYDRLRTRILEEQGALVEASDIVIRQRSRKSPAEIDCMRQAAKYLDITYEAAFDAMQVGALESEVNAAALYAAYMAGADENALPLLISSGINTITCTHLPATHKPIRKGELVLMEAGASVKGYHAVGSHTVICGQSPDTEMKKLYDDARRAANAGLSVIGPGVPYTEVSKAMLAATDKSTYTHDFLEKYYSGYGIGLGFPSIWYEEIFGPATPGALESGQVIALFALSKKEDEYLICTIEPILITDSGFEKLSCLDIEELRVVGV